MPGEYLIMTDSVNEGRRWFLIGASGAVGAVGAAGVAVPFVKSWNPSAKAKAAGAPIKVDISKLEPGGRIIAEWRSKPVWVVRRTEETLVDLAKVEGSLRDPNSEQQQQPDYAKNQYRSLRPEILVLVGLCTHLGCAPSYRPEVGAADLGGDEWLGGFYCPCHGSKFDLSGRVYQGVPAPTNLVVPPYMFESDNVIVVGVDEEVA